MMFSCTKTLLTHRGFNTGPYQCTVLPFYMFLVGVTPESRVLAQGTTPVPSVYSPGHRNEVPSPPAKIEHVSLFVEIVICLGDPF